MSDPLLPPCCGLLKPPKHHDLIPPSLAYTGPTWNEKRARTWAVTLAPLLILAVWSFVR
jgi:hypothetical protein